MPESLSHRFRLCCLPRLYAPRLLYLCGAGRGRSRHLAHQPWLHEAQDRYPPCCWLCWQQMSGSQARSLRQAQALRELSVVLVQQQEMAEEPNSLG